MNITGQVPVNFNVQEPPARQLQLQWADQHGATGAPHGWVIPALIAAALVIAAIVFWPREHAVAPTPTTTSAPQTQAPAPSNGYSDAEREADEAVRRLVAKVEKMQNM